MCVTTLPARTPREPQKDVLFQVLQANLDDFLATVDGDRLPALVVAELHAYLTCADFAAGAACFACGSCNARTFHLFLMLLVETYKRRKIFLIKDNGPCH